ncbi:MAG: sodium:proton antiporter [Candidatus Eisenbacteria bacterium]
MRGVPFTWTFGLVPEWLVMISALLAVFYVIDSRAVRRETPEAMALDVTDQSDRDPRDAQHPLPPRRDRRGLRPDAVAGRPDGGSGGGVYFTTKRHLHLANRFSFFPINEVAILFAGPSSRSFPRWCCWRLTGRVWESSIRGSSSG